MPKTTVYCFTGFDIKEGKSITAKRMATLEAIKGFNGVPLMETAKEVDISELDGDGHYPKYFTVIYSTKNFPLLNNDSVGKQKIKEFPLFEAAKASPFPTNEKYLFASIQVVGGWYTLSAGSSVWEFHEKK
ncbi:MAG: hypothetical protein M0Q01_04875 [Syntrophales bacterium]|jgi:hypothetical protein|nr:hypothetical protein [Syntrophales bacterium]